MESPFYASHKSILDLARGGGYWLWKPFIIKAALEQCEDDTIVVYADTGIEITGRLEPLFEMCTEERPILLFANHYDDAWTPGRNVCSKWTKRDCFVSMNCDSSEFRNGAIVDASFMLFRKSKAAAMFVDEWLGFCSNESLITDEPNQLGYPDLPGFVEHRHDQSILSLLALCHKMEIFRHPSQFGNHVKLEEYRQKDEWKLFEYGSKGIFKNSKYQTLLNHHRKRSCNPIRAIMDAPSRQIYDMFTNSGWNRRSWEAAGLSCLHVEMDVRFDGRFRLVLAKRKQTGATGPYRIDGRYLDVVPNKALKFTWCVGAINSTVSVRLGECDRGTMVFLEHDGLSGETSCRSHQMLWSAFVRAVATTMPCALIDFSC